MSEESNFVAPQGEMQMDFQAPSAYEAKKRRDDIELLNHGSNLGIVQGIVDLGSHMESFDGNPPELKRKIKVFFEHPQLKQFFYEDDTEKRSTVSSFEATYSLHTKSKLRQLIHAFEGKVIKDDEAYKYNITKLLGAIVNVQIEHNPSKKDPTIIYEKVTGVFSHKGLAIPVPFEAENQKYLFFIDKEGKNFLSKNFADLPFYYRKKIMESQEGLDHVAKGGKFAEHPKVDNENHNQPQQRNSVPQNAPSAPSAPSAAKRNVVLKDPSIPLAKWYETGWTDELIVKEGHGNWEEVVSVPSAPSAPSVPSAPSAPQANALFGNDEESDLPF